MSDRLRVMDRGALVAGVILISLGLVFLLDELTVPNLGKLINSYWPLIVVAIGLTKVVDLPTMWSGLGMISAGVWLQAVRLHWHGFTYGNSWPLLLMVLGGGIVLRTVIDPIVRRLATTYVREEEGHEHSR